MSALPSPSPSAHEAAALWAAKIDGGTLEASERQALDAWLAADATHRALLSSYCQFSADLEQQLPALVVSGALAMPTPKRPRSRRLGWALLFSGALAGAAMVAWMVAPRGATSETQTVATSLGERQSLTLADGTRVELNARTSLKVELGPDERRVRIADGQAFFMVAKDARRPFIVATPAGSVRVTGTVFDVRAETAELAVTVVEGSVQVTPSLVGPPSGPVSLTAREQLTTSRSGPVAVRSLGATEVEDALAWRHGEVVFDGTTLASALDRFGRYHGRALNADARCASLRVGGRYRLDDLNSFLSDLQSFLPVHVAQDQASGAITVTARAR